WLAGPQASCHLQNEVDPAAVQVRRLRQIYDQTRRGVGNDRDELGPAIRHIGQVDLTLRCRDRHPAPFDHLDHCRHYHVVTCLRVRCMWTVVPSGRGVTVTWRISSSIRRRPRPRFSPRGGRQRPQSRTVISTSCSVIWPRTSTSPSAAPYACSMTLLHASQQATRIS